MTPADLEAIRRRLADCGPLDAGAGHDAVALVAEVDRLRAALTRIVEDPTDAHHHARRALEGTS